MDVSLIRHVGKERTPTGVVERDMGQSVILVDGIEFGLIGDHDNAIPMVTQLRIATPAAVEAVQAHFAKIGRAVRPVRVPREWVEPELPVEVADDE